jgi:hypothetical protein
VLDQSSLADLVTKPRWTAQVNLLQLGLPHARA